MRCGDVIQAAFLTHPVYREQADAIEAGCKYVIDGKWRMAYYLPQAAARDALTKALPEIVKKQQRSGLWKGKFGKGTSFDTLRALKHAEILQYALSELRYDPFAPFADSSDFEGFIVRRDVMESPLPDDPSLQHQLIASIKETQAPDGSWGETVLRTSLQIERLLDLGVPPVDKSITAGAQWILNQFHESVDRRRNNTSLVVFVENTFTCSDTYSEFTVALEELPEADPKNACFSSLPFIQTALALKALTRAGFGDDQRVLSSFKSLLDVQLHNNVDDLSGTDAPQGRWCAHKCRFKLEERVKAERKAVNQCESVKSVVLKSSGK